MAANRSSSTVPDAIDLQLQEENVQRRGNKQSFIGEQVRVKYPAPVPKCKDSCCLVLILLVAGFFICGIYGYRFGKTDLILYPFDASGNQCGHPDSAASEFDYIYFVDPKNFSDYTVCVKDCRDLSNCYPNDWVTDCSFSIVTKNPDSLVTIEPYSAYDLLHYCIPDHVPVFTEEVSSRINASGFTELMDDIWEIKWLALGLFFPALLLGFTIIVFLAYFPLPCIWTMIVSAAIGSIALIAIFIFNLHKFPYAIETEGYVASILLLVVTIVFVIVSGFVFLNFYKSIEIAAEYAQIAAMFLAETMSLVTKSIFCLKSAQKSKVRVFIGFFVIQILYVILLTALLVVLVTSLVFLYSCRTVPEEEFYSVFGNTTWDSIAKVLFWLQLFLAFPYAPLFFTCWFSLYFALVARSYYYGEKYPIGKMLFLYLGSVAQDALGSYFTKPIFLFFKIHELLLSNLTFIPFASVGVNWLKSHLEFYGENNLYELAHSYCSLKDSADNIKKLLKDRQLNLYNVAGIGWCLGFIGKICITILFMLLGYSCVLVFYYDEMSSPFGPIFVFFIEGVAIAILSTGFFEMTCNCILISYLHDVEPLQNLKVKSDDDPRVKLKKFIKKNAEIKSNKCSCKCFACENMCKANAELMSNMMKEEVR